MRERKIAAHVCMEMKKWYINCVINLRRVSETHQSQRGGI